MRKKRHLFLIFVLSILGFLLGSIGTCTLEPASMLWYVSALLCPVGLTGIFMALTAKIMNIILARVIEDDGQ